MRRKALYPQVVSGPAAGWTAPLDIRPWAEPLRCPRCGVGVLVFVELILPGRYLPSIPPPPPLPMDTS